MAKMKKAQNGIGDKLAAATAERNKKGPALREGQKERMTRIFESNPDRAIKVGKRMLKRANAKAEAPAMKNGGMKKAKNGTEFGMLSVKAGIDKNPKPTQADRIAGAKGMAKSGKNVAKKMASSGATVSMQLGSYKNVIGKNTKGKATKAVGLTKAKYGKTMMKKGGKCKSGC
jgi:hypothetical protein